MIARVSASVKEEYPLKQGLKHTEVSTLSVVLLIVKEEYPLKQGLKRSSKVLDQFYSERLKKSIH